MFVHLKLVFAPVAATVAVILGAQCGRFMLLMSAGAKHAGLVFMRRNEYIE